MWVSYLSHFKTFSSLSLCLSPFGSFHLPKLKDNPYFTIYCANGTFSFLEWSNAIHIITTNIFHGYNCNYSNSIPKKTETTEATHLRYSKLHLLFYIIYEISDWSNRIEIDHKRTHENIKAEKQNSQKIRKYVFPLQKNGGKSACLYLLLLANTFINLQRWWKVDCSSAFGLSILPHYRGKQVTQSLDKTHWIHVSSHKRSYWTLKSVLGLSCSCF